MIRYLPLALLLPALAFAQDWSRSDTVREAIVAAAYLADIGQTRYIARHPERYYENDSAWAIGKHPSTGQVNNYLGAQMIGHAVISYYLPSKYRAAWQYYFMFVEIKAVRNNRG